MKKFPLYLFVLLLSFCSYCSFPTQPTPYIYEIQLGTFLKEEDARAQYDTLKQLKIYPLSLSVESNNIIICFGQFPYYMDAYIYGEVSLFKQQHPHLCI